MIELDSAVNIIISSVSGAAVSWAISHYYFRKETRAEVIADQIRNGLQRALIPVLYPQYFRQEKRLVVHPTQPIPKNLDVPHVEYAIFADGSIHPGQKVDVLLKVRDLGFDLPNPDGISIRDHRNNALGIIPLGLGYVETTLHTFPEDHPGPNKLTVELQDLGVRTKSVPNKSVVTLGFIIVKGDSK
jgi:hypothetical protein